MKVRKIIENDKASIFIGETPDPFEDSSDLLIKVFSLLRMSMPIEIQNTDKGCLLIKISGHSFSVFCDDLMPLSIHANDKASNYIIDIIQEKLEQANK